MNDSTKKILFTVLAGLPTLMVVWIFSLYFFGCGSTNSCTGIQLPEMTSIPTLPAATMPAPKVGVDAAAAAPKCHIAALNLIGAWVTGGYTEKDPFSFTDVKGTNCTGIFKDDVQKLFVTPNLWYDGAPACITCHYADIAKATKNMDLSSYSGILAGSNRLNGAAKGNDILGGGNWDNALLHQMLYAPDGRTLIGRPAMPLGRPASVPAEGPIVSAGIPSGGTAPATTPVANGTASPTESGTAAAAPTATPIGSGTTNPTESGPTATAPAATSVENGTAGPTESGTAAIAPAVTPTENEAATTVPGTAADIARPSNPGGAGLAITLKGDIKSGEQIFAQNCVVCHAARGAGGIQNPGSTDGTVPTLNPIDTTIKDANPITFAYNIDLFVEHGSTPEGTGPALKMPAWGDAGTLVPQQIADVISYLISLNQ